MTDLLDLDAERSTLGAVLLTETNLPVLAGEIRLAPEDFYNREHARVFAAMLALHDRGDHVDVLTTIAELRREGVVNMDAFVHELTVFVPAAGNADEYARIVKELAAWRAVKLAGHALVVAAEARDHAERERAETLLAYAGARPAEHTYEPRQLAQKVYDWLDGAGGWNFSFGFPVLDELTFGGMRAGQLTLIGGWANHGKSPLLDQILTHAHGAGASVHLYMNEMTVDERGMRQAASKARVPLRDLMLKRLDQSAAGRVVEALGHLCIPITEASGWSARDITRHARRREAQIVGVDILHQIPHRDERDLAMISQELTAFARQAERHVIATVHLNESRVTAADRPAPALGDIRGSGMLKNDAHNVVFLHREQNDLGWPQPESRIYVSKARSGDLGGFKAYFFGNSGTFAPTQ